MSDQPDALRQAAAMLLNAASTGAILAAMRGLLADWEAERPAAEPAQKPLQAVRAARRADATPMPAKPPATTVASPQRLPAVAAMAATQDAEREEWEALRQRVREQRNARGLTVAALADALGMARTTTKTALTCRRPPSARLRERLTEWLKTPEVVPAEDPFRRRTGNGAGRGHTATGNCASRGGAGAATDHAAV
jgi:ribosome-binding protein aMBF1 (putative translation factor)